MEEEILLRRREEEGRGKVRRKALLEKEERKWKEIEASLMSSIPNAGSREAAAMAAAVRAVGGDSVLDDSFARERVSSIARRIRSAQLSRRALQVLIVIAYFFSPEENKFYRCNRLCYKFMEGFSFQVCYLASNNLVHGFYFSNISVISVSSQLFSNCFKYLDAADGNFWCNLCT